MTMRLSARSFAGTARTLVAVGTVSETFMFLTTLAAAPRRGDCVPAATGGAAVLAGLFAGLGGGGLPPGGLGGGGVRGRGGGGVAPGGGPPGGAGGGALGAGVLGAGAAVVVARGVASRDGAGESEAGAATGSAGAAAPPFGDGAGAGFSRSAAPTGLPGR